MRAILCLKRSLRYVQRVCDQFSVKPLIAVWCPLKPLFQKGREMKHVCSETKKENMGFAILAQV